MEPKSRVFATSVPELGRGRALGWRSIAESGRMDMASASAYGPHSRRAQGAAGGPGPGRPLSRVALVHRVPQSYPGEFGGMQRSAASLPTKGARARQSPYLRHMPAVSRDKYLVAIGSLKEEDIDDDETRIEKELKSQLSKIVSPIKAPRGWRKGIAGENSGILSNSSSATRKGKKGFTVIEQDQLQRPQQQQEQGLFSPVDDFWPSFQVSPMTNQTVVATPMSDLSEREFTPGQYSGQLTAATSNLSGTYGDFEENCVAVDDEAEFLIW